MSVENIVAMVFSAIALTCSIVILIRDIKKKKK